MNWSRLGFILADAPKLERNFEARARRSEGHRRHLGAALGRTPLRAQPLHGAARDAAREDRSKAQPHRGVSRVRRWRGISLRVSGAGDAVAGEHRRGAHRVRHCRSRHRVVDSGWRVESLRISLSEDSADGGVAGPYADHPEDRERRAHRDSRSGAGGLRGHVAAACVGTTPEGRAVAVVVGPSREPQGAIRHAVAHAADRAIRARSVHVQPHPQSQRAQQARRCVAG